MSPAVSPEDRLIRVGDLTFHVRVWSDEGHPIVLLHGLASSSHVWDLVAPLLAPRYRVVAIDQRGHGESDKPETGYDLPTFVADLRGIVGALELQRPALVGHSWGGNLALQYAVTYPADVSHLALVDGGIIEMQLRDGMTWDVAEKQMAPPDISMPLPAFVERMRNRLGAIYSDDVRDAILGNVWVDQRGVVRARLTRERHMLIARALWEHRPSRLYEKVRCPTLVVAAEPPNSTADPDRLRWKRRAMALAEQRLPRSHILWMRETIHDIPLHRPDDLASALARLIQST
ncbi:MAG TPA: alpha/beta hydrolase [Chloroflexota bacterium]|nr:alpha/beta hydrolase [Chloroflexota bacterium]